MTLRLPAACFCLCLVAATPSTQVFPSQFQGSWGDTLASCEPEFTHGFTIEKDEIGYYEGIDQIIYATPVTTIKTKLGAGLTMVVDLEYRHHKHSSTSSDRFTLIGNMWLYRRDSQLPMSKHLSIKYRTIRCPPGSTDG